MTLNNIIGRKGSLESLKDYWDVATFFEISVLAQVGIVRASCAADDGICRYSAVTRFVALDPFSIGPLFRRQEYTKTIQAAEMMFRMEPPIWYLKSTIGNISLIERFRKQREEHELEREETLFRFWMDFFVEATKDNMTTDLR